MSLFSSPFAEQNKEKKMKNKNRVYLNCPYSEKDICKGAGGRWDPEVKKWYVPEGDDPNLFKRWLSKKNDNKQPLLKIVE